MRESRNIGSVDPVAREPGVKTHPFGQGEAVISDLLDEGMMKTKTPIDGSQVTQLDKTRERWRHDGYVMADEESGIPQVEHLAGDRGALK
jgi:hypothetical protein